MKEDTYHFDKYTVGYRNLTIHYYFWIIITFFPALKWISGGVGTAQKLLHIVFAIFLLYLLALKRPEKFNRGTWLGIILFPLLLSSYYIVCTLLYTSELDVADISDFSRPFVYVIYLVFPLLYPLSEKELDRFLKFFFMLCGFQIAFSALVYFDIFWPLLDLYKGRMSDDPVFFHFFRWSGTFGYPSDFSYYLSFFIYYQFFKLIHAPSQFSYRDWIFVMFCFIALILTLSRGGIGTVVIMLGFSYLLTRAKYSLIVNFMLIFLIIGSVFTFMFISLEDSNYENLNLEYIVTAFDGDEMDDSAKHRIVEMKIALEYFDKCFPFGCGSNRVELKKRINVIESLYGYHFSKWGLIGFIVYLFFIIWILLHIGFAIKSYDKRSHVSVFLHAVFLLILSVPVVFGFSSAISDRFKGLPLHFVMAGYAMSFYVHKIKRTKQINADL